MSLPHKPPSRAATCPQTLQNQEPRGLTVELVVQTPYHTGRGTWGLANPDPSAGGQLVAEATSTCPPWARGRHVTPAQPIGFFPGTLTLAKRGTGRVHWAQGGSLPSHPCTGPAPQSQARELCPCRGCFRSFRPAPMCCRFVRFCHLQPQNWTATWMQAKPQEPRTTDTVPNT